MRKIFFIVTMVIAPLITFADVLKLPQSNDKNELKLRGKGAFKKFGFHVYDISLWSESITDNSPFVKPPFALQLTYAMNIKSKNIVNASIKQLKRKKENQTFIPQWKTILKHLIPSVKKGDTLTGIRVGNESTFYLNGQYLGVVKNSSFTQAFFDIWLGDHTSAPKLRRTLLQLSQ